LSWTEKPPALAGVTDKAVRLWDVTTGKELRHIAGDGTDLFAFSPDAKLLADQTKNKMIRLWEVATAQELRQLDNQDRVFLCVRAKPLTQTERAREFFPIFGQRGKRTRTGWRP
jgi:WD40 repeat protein